MASQTDWETSANSGAVGNDLNKNNSSGFSSMPGGYRDYYGTFMRINRYSNWWSATEDTVAQACNSLLGYDLDYLYRSHDIKENGFSVRLVKD